MRASIATKLSIYEFGKIVGINPLHLGQVTFVPSGVTPKLCDQAYMQYDWQDADRVSRESIASAIAEAEALVERYLGFRLAPTWEVDEWRDTERFWRPELVNLNVRDVRGYGPVVQANWGHFISGGVQAKVALAEGTPIVYSDVDSDTYKETATVTVAVPLNTDPCELHVFYPLHSGDAAWEIRPIHAVVTGLQAVITFRREQCVLEALQEAIFPEPLDGLDDTNFLTTVDVYHVYNDPQTQALMLWEPLGTGCGCGGAGCSTCAYSVQTGCIHLRDDPRLSLVAYTPAEWNTTTQSFTSISWSVGRQPDIVRLYYYSGLRDKTKPCTQEMDNQWKRTIAHFAAALLDRPPCDCVLAEWEYWRQDRALVSGSGPNSSEQGLYQISGSDLDCPFGTRRGAIDAWHRCIHQAIGRVAVPY